MENRGSIAALESAAKCGRRLLHWGNLARLRAGAVRDFFLDPRDSIKPGTKEYQRHLREEVEHYSKLFAAERLDSEARDGNLFEPVPAVWQVAQERSAALLREKTGDDVTDHLIKRLQKRPGIRMASLGCGPGGIELMLAAEAPSAQFVCLDINEELIHLGRERALASGLPVRFEKADLNTARLPANEFDIVFCHASLHHILELEWLADQIKQSLRQDGELIVVDILAPNGHRMRPRTREIASAIWRTLPPRFRVNHTAYKEKRLDRKMWDKSTSRTGMGMECIRSGEVLSVLARRFSVKLQVPYMTLSRRFFDTMYGWNYRLEQPLDRAIFEWIWALDCHYLSTGELQGESVFSIYGV